MSAVRSTPLIDPALDPGLPRKLFDYDVIDLIGQGAGSLIYVVSDPRNNQLFALKHVVRKTDKDDRFIEQLENELEVGSQVKHPGLLPLWQEARRLTGQLSGFEMRHTLRGGNKEADRLANEAMDQGTGKKKVEQGVTEPSRTPNSRSDRTSPPKQASRIIEGFVKNGVVHPLEGELPEGTFVKILCD